MAQSGLRAAGLGGVLCAASACGGDAPIEPVAPAVAIRVTGVPAWAPEGIEIQLTATLLDAADNPTSGGAITWVSNTPLVASISGSGLVTTRGGGDADIYAISNHIYQGIRFPVVDSLVTDRIALDHSPVGLAVSGGKAIMTTDSDSLMIMSVVTGQTSTFLPMAGRGLNIALDPAGTRGYVTHQDLDYSGSSELDVIDMSSSTVISTVQIPGSAYAVLVSHDGSTVWVTSTGDKNRVFAIDAVSLTIVDSVMVPGLQLVQHPTLPRLYVSHSESFFGAPDLYELDTSTLDSLRSWALSGIPRDLAFSGDGARLYVANENGWIDAIDLGTGSQVARVALPRFARSIALSPDGSTLAVTVGNPYNYGDVVASVRFLDPTTLATKDVLLIGGSPTGLAYTGSGSQLIVPNQLGWVDFIR